MPPVKVAMALRAGADQEVFAANLAFHLRAGIDVIVVWADASEHAASLAEGLQLDERVRLAPSTASASSTAARRWTADEVAADWLIESESHEFWWPRFSSIHDALAAVPPGFNAAQAVVRTLFATAAEGPFEERVTMRLSPRAPSLDEHWQPLRRFAVRTDAIWSDPADYDVLWGYYPFEVLRLAENGRADPSEETRRALELGVLLPDDRLQNVLRRLRTTPPEPSAFSSIGEPLAFPSPTPAEDAVFALEAAVLDDLELSLARQQLDVISRRLATIERSRLLRAEAGLRRVRHWRRRKRAMGQA